MDVGLYREDEQFSFTSSAYLECYSSDSASFTIEQNELFEEIRPMPQPPNELFEWHSDEAEKELNDDIDMIDQSHTSHEEVLSFSPPTKDDLQLQTIFGIPNWQPVWQTSNPKMEHTPIDENFIVEEHMQITNSKITASLQEILELPEISTLDPPPFSIPNVKIEGGKNTRRPSSLSESSESTMRNTRSYRTESESSDILNTSFGTTDITNFDIAEYVFEENKQTKKSIEVPKVKIEHVESVQITKEPCIEEKNIHNIKPVVNIEVPKRVVKAGVKKIDMRAQKYIIEQDMKKSFSEDDTIEEDQEEDMKKSFSEDECDIDIETVSEEESSPVLEAGDLTDLLEQFEATEVKNKEHIKSNGNPLSINKQNVSLNVKVQIKAEMEEPKSKLAPPITKIEPKIDRKQNEIIKPVKIKQEKVEPSNTKVEPGKSNPPKDQTPQQIPPEQLYINDIKVDFKPTAKVQETTTTFSKIPGKIPSQVPATSSNRQILDSLPQELINRIKESGKRKPITVIQPIPNNRKRSKVQEVPKEVPKPLPPTSSETVHLDHNYCSNGSSPSKQISKKDSGFASSEEDDKTIISRQPTVKNADGTLMVSLLKANTIRQIDSMINQKKKLNLEEYKKRRNGLVTPKNNSQSCSPNTSTCSSPLPEDEHQKMLKHQEKLRKMAQELLNSAPKSEKKEDQPSSTLTKVPTLHPVSPVASCSVPPSQPDSPSPAKERPVKTEFAVKPEPAKERPVKKEIPVKPELTSNQSTNPPCLTPVKHEVLVKVDVHEKVPTDIKPPKVPPNLERKILVSFGVNTDFKIARDEDPLAPVEKLQEMKPLLEKVSSQLGEHSLISSVIENIPKVLDKNDKPDKLDTTSKDENYEHGEYKQVIYLEKDRVRCETKDAETQTNISLIEQTKRGRIRRRVSSSSSSCSSYKSKESSSRRSRKSSDSSTSSRSSVSSRSSTSSSRSEYSSRNSSRLSYSRSRSRSPRYSRRRRDSSAEHEHMNAVEERRIIYVGKIAKTTSKDDLRKKFNKFGPINKISLHFRDVGENYGFVTFKYKEDAHEAYEHGNDDSSHPCYKISFGGRREFCKAAYSDLDNMRDDAYYQSQASGDSYDQLLKDALEKLKKRKV